MNGVYNLAYQMQIYSVGILVEGIGSVMWWLDAYTKPSLVCLETQLKRREAAVFKELHAACGRRGITSCTVSHG